MHKYATSFLFHYFVSYRPKSNERSSVPSILMHDSYFKQSKIKKYQILINKLKRNISIEKQIAQNRDKLEKHIMKWRPFLDNI